MTVRHLIKQVSEIGAPTSPEGRMVRFKELFDYLLLSHTGNLCEVGAGAGLTTRIMLDAAKRYNRRVLVIDPFEDEWNTMPDGYGKPYPFSVFADNTVGYRDQLVLCRHNSMSSYATDALRSFTPIAFVFLDGLQYFENVLQELNMMASLGAEIICVDDFNRVTKISQVPLAVASFLSAPECKYEFLDFGLIEGYLIKKQD